MALGAKARYYAVDDAVFNTLVLLAVWEQERDPKVNCFTFSKSRFIAAYKWLKKRGLVGPRKWETLLRNLRKYAEQGRLVRYVDRRNGLYRVCVTSLELDPRYEAMIGELRGLARGEDTPLHRREEGN